MSQFTELLSEIESKRCITCSGLGEYDDSAPGDIAYNKFHCTMCNGTGFTNGQAYQATPLQGGDVR